jgi:hypothetical protein
MLWSFAVQTISRTTIAILWIDRQREILNVNQQNTVKKKKKGIA